MMAAVRNVKECRHRHQLRLHFDVSDATIRSRNANADDFPIASEVSLDLSREGDKERRVVLCGNGMECYQTNSIAKINTKAHFVFVYENLLPRRSPVKGDAFSFSFTRSSVERPDLSRTNVLFGETSALCDP